MQMKIGSYYRTNHGVVIGPMIQQVNGSYPSHPWTSSALDKWWDNDGTYEMSRSCPWDLVEEVLIVPVPQPVKVKRWVNVRKTQPNFFTMDERAWSCEADAVAAAGRTHNHVATIPVEFEVMP